MLKRLAIAEFDWRPLGDLIATFVKAHHDSCNLSVIVTFLAQSCKLSGTGIYLDYPDMGTFVTNSTKGSQTFRINKVDKDFDQIRTSILLEDVMHQKDKILV